VRDFTAVTALLEEEVICFINCVGFIIQGCVHRWSGVANKNVGDAFVVLWKAPEIEISKQMGPHTADAVNKVSEIADRSLMGFVKIIAECRRSPDVDFYNRHELLIRNVDRWRVRIGMSLHVGWAIEGPVGSDFKIDATYLSPAVSICELLESATKVYGVPIIASESHYKLLSLRAKERMRKMDVVKCMDKVMGLYTFNVNFGSKVDDFSRDKRKHSLADLLKDEGLADISSATLEAEGAEFLFIIDRDVQKIQEGLPEELESEYREALCQYLEGSWEQAQEVLERILKTIWPADGPSTALYRELEEHGFKAPKEWSGYHLLDQEMIAKRSKLPLLKFEEDRDPAEEENLRQTTSTTLATGVSRRARNTGGRKSNESKGPMPVVRQTMVKSAGDPGEMERLPNGEFFRPGDWR
jgi:class 3 adenylate cyclase